MLETIRPTVRPLGIFSEATATGGRKLPARTLRRRRVAEETVQLSWLQVDVAENDDKASSVSD